MKEAASNQPQVVEASDVLVMAALDTYTEDRINYMLAIIHIKMGIRDRAELVLNHTENNTEKSSAKTSITTKIITLLKAVSYTHLDVYKRQLVLLPYLLVLKEKED